MAKPRLIRLTVAVLQLSSPMVKLMAIATNITANSPRHTPVQMTPAIQFSFISLRNFYILEGRVLLLYINQYTPKDKPALN